MHGMKRILTTTNTYTESEAWYGQIKWPNLIKDLQIKELKLNTVKCRSIMPVHRVCLSVGEPLVILNRNAFLHV
jgi:hypothetical protein